VADMMSRIPEVKAIDVLNFETVEFIRPEYLKRINSERKCGAVSTCSGR